MDDTLPEARERVPVAPVGSAAPDALVPFPDAPVSLARSEASELKPALTKA